MLYKTNLLVSKNCRRQGAPSAGGEGIVTYVEPPKSRSNAVLGDLYNQHRVRDAYGTRDVDAGQ